MDVPSGFVGMAQLRIPGGVWDSPVEYRICKQEDLEATPWERVPEAAASLTVGLDSAVVADHTAEYATAARPGAPVLCVRVVRLESGTLIQLKYTLPACAWCVWRAGR